MKKLWNYIFLTLFLIVSIVLIKAEITRLDYAEFDNEFFIFLYSLFVIFSVVLFYRRRKYHIIHKKTITLLPLLLPLVVAATIAVVKIQRHQKQNIPAFFIAGYPDEIDGFEIEFRTDSTYRIKEHREFDGESYYGSFTISSDTFILDKSYKALTISMKLLPKIWGLSEQNPANPVLCQYSKYGKREKGTELPIILDKR
jgi:amino acid transporter